MAEIQRMPLPGEFGTELLSVAIGPIGGTNNIGGASPFTANNTTTYRLGGLGRLARVAQVVTSVTTVPADADGTILATVYKYNATTDAQVALTGSIDLEALTTREGTVTRPLATQTDAQLTVGAADTVEIAVVNNSAAINTQPVDLWFRVFFYALQ